MPTGKRVIKAVRTVSLAGVLGVLIFQLSDIGWDQVLSSLPQHPLFYLLLVAMYLLLPLTESLIYGRLWRLRPLSCLPIMIRKRVLNVDVVGYSGEIYLFTWAKGRVAQPAGKLMGMIKDNLILSSAASFSAAAVLLGGLALTGQIDLGALVDTPRPLYAGLAALAAVFLGSVLFRFRHVIFSLTRRTLTMLGVAHMLRFVIGYVLQIAAWWIVIPSAAFETWAVLLVVSVVINRIPFLPSSDLVFVSAGAGLTPLLDVPVAPVVSMLLVRSAFDRILNLLLFSSTVWRERHAVSTTEDVGEGTDWEGPQVEDNEEEEIPASLNT